MYCILFYEVVNDYVERRAPYRAEHLALAAEAHARGELALAGAYANPTDGAALVFRGEPRVAQEFAERDPYVKNGVVTSFVVREWTVVVGADS